MTPFIHAYADRACVCDGAEMRIVPLTENQIVRLAAEFTKLASDILERRDDRSIASGAMACGPHTADARG